MADLAPISLNPSTFLKRFQKVNTMLDRFWVRLVQELGPHLNAYKKWSNIKRNIAVGDVGVLIDPTRRNHFPLVRVSKVGPTRDGNVRRLVLTDGKKSYSRSLNNFSLLVPAENNL